MGRFNGIIIRESTVNLGNEKDRRTTLVHYKRCVALKEVRKTNGAKICSLAPGIIDTDMQTQLRESDPQAFPDRAQFVACKNEGHLLSSDVVATKVLAYLASDDFGAQPVADVRD